MKLFLAILAAMFFIIPVNNLRAQGTHCLRIDTNLSPWSGERNLSHVPLIERMVARREDVSRTFSNKQAQRNSGSNKTAVPDGQVYLPDSLTLYSMSDTLRISASYDPRGWNDQIVAQVWLSGHWVNYTQQTWTYLGSNENNLTLHQTWLNGQWTNVELDSSTYDARGNMLVHLTKYWSQGAWKDSLLSSRIYDANGNMLTNVGWVMINNQWTNSWQGTYTYDANGNELSFRVEGWGNGQWVNMDLWTYTYDQNGHMLTFLSQNWNGQWQNGSLSTYTYDASGNMLSNLEQISANGLWTNSTLHTYTYDANGKMLTDWLKGWTNAAWMNGSLYTYTYDTNGNLVNELLQYWLNGLWTNSQQSTFTYDAHGNELAGNNTTWSGSSWAPADHDFVLAVNGSTYDFTGYRIIVSWILLNTTDVSRDMSNILKGYSLSQNYPNPFNPSTTIRYEVPKSSVVRLSVYDILGREVSVLVDEAQQPGIHAVQFDGNRLASGVYFYKIQAGSFVETRKLLLIR